MNNNPIGIIDSGIGGVSVFQKIVKELPNESIIYLADSKNCPYGAKSKNEIYLLSKRLIQFLLKQNIKALIIACNSITVACLDELRKDFLNIPIIGTVPVIKTASNQTKNGRIGVLSTIATAKSEYQKKLIEKFATNLEVVNLGTDKLVPFVERGEADSAEVIKILKQDLAPFKNSKVDVVVLGCTHFPFLKNSIKSVLGNKVVLLDSGSAIARQTRRILEQNNDLANSKSPSYLFYTTGDRKEFERVIGKLTKSFLGKVKEVNI